jgi:HPt (histidine-containing phosphotransfer) domain-containing protein
MDRDAVLAEIRSYLSEEFSMDSDEIAEMTALFLESLSSAAAKAGNALSADDFEQLAAVGHSLKGSAANIGASALSALGAGLDDAARSGDAALCAEKTAEIAEADAILNGGG